MKRFISFLSSTTELSSFSCEIAGQSEGIHTCSNPDLSITFKFDGVWSHLFRSAIYCMRKVRGVLNTFGCFNWAVAPAHWDVSNSRNSLGTTKETLRTVKQTRRRRWNVGDGCFFRTQANVKIFLRMARRWEWMPTEYNRWRHFRLKNKSGEKRLWKIKNKLFVVCVGVWAGSFSCHHVGLDEQLRTIYTAVPSMGVARGYYGAAYPAGECVDVLCPVSCMARRVSRREKGGLCRKWTRFSRCKTPLHAFRRFIFSFCSSDLFAWRLFFLKVRDFVQAAHV